MTSALGAHARPPALLLSKQLPPTETLRRCYLIAGFRILALVSRGSCPMAVRKRQISIPIGSFAVPALYEWRVFRPESRRNARPSERYGGDTAGRIASGLARVARNPQALSEKVFQMNIAVRAVGTASRIQENLYSSWDAMAML